MSGIIPDTYSALIKALLHNLDDRCGICGETAALPYEVFGHTIDVERIGFAVCVPCARLVEGAAKRARTVP